jgi:molybdate transport system substrate-binding protein
MQSLKAFSATCASAVFVLAAASTPLHAQPANPSSAAPGPAAGSMAPLPGAMTEKLADAKPGELRVFASAAMYLPLESVRKQAESAVGAPVRIQYGSARGDLKSHISDGQAFDVAILLPDVIHDPGVASKVDPHEYPLATIPVGIAMRGDAPSPDVSTPAALRTALLNSRAVKYAPTGAARATVDRVLSSLGVADKINDVSGVLSNVTLAPGEYEIDFFPISEILPNHRLKNLGLVPEPLQVPVQIEAVIARGADVGAAQAFVRFLEGPAIDPQLKSSGMVKAR